RIQMRTQHHKLIRLLAAAEFSYEVGSGNRPADVVRNGKIGVEGNGLTGGQQASHASRVLARHEDLREAVQFALAGIRVAIEKIIRTGRLESNRQSFAFDRTVNDAGSFQILGEEIVPFLHFLRVHQQQSAGYIASSREIL